MLQKFATIRARILLLAACGIIACGLVTGLAVHALDRAQADYTEMVSHSLTGKIATLSIARDLNYVSRLTRNMMLGSNLEKDTERLEKTARSMRDGFNELREAATTQEERDRIAQAEQSTMRFSQETLAFARSLVDVPVEDRHMRHKEYQKIVTPLAETSRKHFEELENLEDKAFDAALATYDDDLRSGRVMLLSLSGGVVGLLLLLGAAIVRSIVLPLGAATAYARAVEAGNFDDIDADRFGGEIRVLLGSMRSMVAELKRRIGFAQGVLRSLPLPCAILGTDGRVQWANDALAQLSGARDAKGLVGGAGSTALPSPHAVSLCDDALRRDTVRRAELPLDDEGERVVDITASPVHDLDGTALGVMACLFDLSELRGQQRLVLDRNRILAEAADNACSVSRKVVDSTTAVDGNVRDSLRRADMQGSRTAEVAVAVEQMNASVAEVARSASMAASSAEDAHTRAAEGRDVVQRAVSAMAEVDGQAQRLRSEMGELAAKAEGIGRIVGVITDIADQTNLLALNAAIEAARAGDAGRGFAVVADEVRKLAEKTMTATREVEGFVRSMQDSSHRSVRATEETTATAGRASGLAADAGEALAAILGITSTTADQVRAIATASEEQSAASEQIARSTTEIRAAAGETSDALRGIERAMGDVRRMSDELSSIVTTMRA